jgi:hypothetical protein
MACFLRRGGLIVVLCTLVGLLSGVWWGVNLPKRYMATTVLHMVLPPQAHQFEYDCNAEDDFSSECIQMEPSAIAELAKFEPIIEGVAAHVGSSPADILPGLYSFTTSTEPFLNLRVVDTSPAKAEKIVIAWQETLKNYVADIQRTRLSNIIDVYIRTAADAAKRQEYQALLNDVKTDSVEQISGLSVLSDVQLQAVPPQKAAAILSLTMAGLLIGLGLATFYCSWQPGKGA